MKSTAISVVATVVLVFTVVGILWGLLGWATLPLAETRGCGEMWLDGDVEGGRVPPRAGCSYLGPSWNKLRAVQEYMRVQCTEGRFRAIVPLRFLTSGLADILCRRCRCGCAGVRQHGADGDQARGERARVLRRGELNARAPRWDLGNAMPSFRCFRIWNSDVRPRL